MFRRIIATALLILLVPACKSDEGTIKEDPAATQTNVAVADPPEAAPAAVEAPADGTFGALVQGATQLTVTQTEADGEADYGGSARVMTEAAWLTKFMAAIGPDTPAGNAVPRCPSTYKLVFANADGELATFGAVCGGVETVVLVRDGSSYAASDPATAREMLKKLATIPRK